MKNIIVVSKKSTFFFKHVINKSFIEVEIVRNYLGGTKEQ